MGGVLGKQWLDGVAYEATVHLDYCRSCHFQTPIKVWWRYNRPSVTGPQAGDYEQKKQKQNEMREQLRHRYHLCSLCAWDRFQMRQKDMTPIQVEKLSNAFRFRRREAALLNTGGLRAAVELKRGLNDPMPDVSIARCRTEVRAALH